MADSNTQKLYVEGATDEAALKGTLALIGEEKATAKVFKTGAIIEISAEKADALLKAGTLSIDGKDHPVTPPRERTVKPTPVPPIPPGKAASKKEQKPPAVPQPRKEPVMVKPAVVVRRVDVSGDQADLEKEHQALNKRRERIEEQEAYLRRWEKRLRGEEEQVPKFGPAVTDFILRNGAGAILLYPQKFGEQDLCAALILPKHRALLVGTHAATARTLELIRAFLLVQILSATTEQDRAAAVKGQEAFEQALEVETKEDEAAAAKPAPIATIGEGQKAKQDRKGGKAKPERKAPTTAETPVPAPASTTESTTQPAAPQ